jgi:hypothetical protein
MFGRGLDGPVSSGASLLHPVSSRIERKRVLAVADRRDIGSVSAGKDGKRH